MQRKKTLMVEYKQLKKANAFVDKRIGGVAAALLELLHVATFSIMHISCCMWQLSSNDSVLQRHATLSQQLCRVGGAFMLPRLRCTSSHT